MVKRAIAGLLWFVATLWFFNFASAFFGVPSFVGFLVAAGIGGFIGADPLKVYWRIRRPTVAVASVARPEFFPAAQPTR
jgi:hypothetical protein